jgi:cephalosporin hydroxylase
MLPSNFDSIRGWCTKEKALTLMNLVYQSSPKLSLELGVFGGRSLVVIAIAAKKVNPLSKVIGVDAWTSQASLEGTNDKANDDWWSKIDYDDMYAYTKKIMIENEVDSVVDLWKCKSNECVNRFEDTSIDLLHQDSNHSEEISCEEVELFWNKVKVGGHWIFDDANWPTTQEAQKRLVSKGYEEIYASSQNEWKIFKRIL